MNILKLFGSIIKIVYPRMGRVTINGEQARATCSTTIEIDPEDNIELKDISIPGFTNHAYRGEQRKKRRGRKSDLARVFESWERSSEGDVFSLRRLFRCESERAARAERRLRLRLEEEGCKFWEEEEEDETRDPRERRADAVRRLGIRLEEEDRKFWEEEDRIFWEEEAAARGRERRSLGLEEEVEIVTVGDDDDPLTEVDVITVEDDDPSREADVITVEENMDWAYEGGCQILY